VYKYPSIRPGDLSSGFLLIWQIVPIIPNVEFIKEDHPDYGADCWRFKRCDLDAVRNHLEIIHNERMKSQRERAAETIEQLKNEIIAAMRD